MYTWAWKERVPDWKLRRGLNEWDIERDSDRRADFRFRANRVKELKYSNGVSIFIYFFNVMYVLEFSVLLLKICNVMY